MALQSLEALSDSLGFELSHQALFSDAGAPTEKEHLALSAPGVLHQEVQCRQVVIPANEHRTDDRFIH